MAAKRPTPKGGESTAAPPLRNALLLVGAAGYGLWIFGDQGTGVVAAS